MLWLGYVLMIVYGCANFHFILSPYFSFFYFYFALLHPFFCSPSCIQHDSWLEICHSIFYIAWCLSPNLYKFSIFCILPLCIHTIPWMFSLPLIAYGYLSNTLLSSSDRIVAYYGYLVNIWSWDPVCNHFWALLPCGSFYLMNDTFISYFFYLLPALLHLLSGQGNLEGIILFMGIVIINRQDMHTYVFMYYIHFCYSWLDHTFRSVWTIKKTRNHPRGPLGL